MEAYYESERLPCTKNYTTLMFTFLTNYGIIEQMNIGEIYVDNGQIEKE